MPRPNGMPLGLPGIPGLPLLPGVNPHILDPRFGRGGELDLSKPKSPESESEACLHSGSLGESVSGSASISTSDSGSANCINGSKLKRSLPEENKEPEVIEKKPRIYEFHHNNNNNNNDNEKVEQLLPPSNAPFGIPSIEERLRLMHQHVQAISGQAPPPLMSATPTRCSPTSSTPSTPAPPVLVDMEKIREEVTRSAMKQIADLRSKSQLKGHDELHIKLVLQK